MKSKQIEVIKNSKRIEELEQDKQNLNKIVNKLEQRISILEKVLASHAKCIGQLQEEKKDD